MTILNSFTYACAKKWSKMFVKAKCKAVEINGNFKSNLSTLCYDILISSDKHAKSITQVWETKTQFFLLCEKDVMLGLHELAFEIVRAEKTVQLSWFILMWKCDYIGHMQQFMEFGLPFNLMTKSLSNRLSE